MKISAVILAKNAEKYIEKSVGSVLFCDEILVIDDDSTDGTIKIVQKLGAIVYKKALAGDFASQRNFALKKARGEWTLFVDADEIVTEDLKNEIVEKINNADNQIAGYFIKRQYLFFGKLIKNGEIKNTKLLRLARRNAGLWVRKIHEFWNIKGEVGEFQNYLIHAPHISVANFIEKMNRWSDIHAQENFSEGKHSSIVKIIFWPVLKFIRSYVLNLGFLEGVQGFLLAVLMSFHSFLAWSKLWIRERK